MYDYNLKLSKLETAIQAFMSATFDNVDEELNINKQLKFSLKEAIETVFLADDLSESEKSRLIKRSLTILAISTGCAEDLQISEIVLDDLYDRNIINQDELNYFYEHASTARWE